MLACVSRSRVALFGAQADPDGEIVETFGLNEEGMMKTIAGGRWKPAIEEYYHLYEAMHDESVRMFPGIAELLGWLRERGVKTALITGKGQRSCAITLEKFGIGACFDARLDRLGGKDEQIRMHGGAACALRADS